MPHSGAYAVCHTFRNLELMRHTTLHHILPTLLLILAAARGYAQCPSNKHQFEVAGSYGLKSSTEVFNSDSYKEQTASAGNMFITARYFLFNRLAFGLSGGMLTTKGTFSSKYDPVARGTYQEQINTVAMEFYYIYFFRKYMEVYTIVGFGPGFYTTTTSTFASASQPASSVVEKHDAVRLQYTPIGIRVGGRIGAFAELGVGYKGLVNAGLSIKLGPSCWWRG